MKYASEMTGVVVIGRIHIVARAFSAAFAAGFSAITVRPDFASIGQMFLMAAWMGGVAGFGLSVWGVQVRAESDSLVLRNLFTVRTIPWDQVLGVAGSNGLVLTTSRGFVRCSAYAPSVAALLTQNRRAQGAAERLRVVLQGHVTETGSGRAATFRPRYEVLGWIITIQVGYALFGLVAWQYR